MVIEDQRLHIGKLRDNSKALTNPTARTNANVEKMSEVNRKLAEMFHTGKSKRMKGKGFAAISNEAAEEDLAFKLALDMYYAFMIRLWKKN